MMRCCIKAYAHFKAAKVGVSRSPFFESDGAGGVNIDLLTSIAKRTASLTVLYDYAVCVRSMFNILLIP